ncbi:hypothetical protein, partial [Vibrio cholerae]|uniref:hypothetical protein n=1 Tax=Vibrio cholerae TaxID=666 RepID=UPI001F220826
NFTPRAYGRRDFSGNARAYRKPNFNPRACGRRDHGGDAFIFNREYFNPRACGRRDFGDLTTQTESNVSIHAPAGGATAIIDLSFYRNKFQSTR